MNKSIADNHNCARIYFQVTFSLPSQSSLLKLPIDSVVSGFENITDKRLSLLRDLMFVWARWTVMVKYKTHQMCVILLVIFIKSFSLKRAEMESFLSHGRQPEVRCFPI